MTADTFLRKLLRGGPMPAAEAVARGAKCLFTQDQLKRAKRRLGVIVTKETKMNGRWFWSLPAPRRTAELPSGRGYGIVVIDLMGGASPIEDPAGFDGWYYLRDLAQLMFEYYKEQYPNAVVHLVECVESEWRRPEQSDRDRQAVGDETRV
jgi:hypothetical protein